MVLLVPHGAAKGRYVNLTKAKASFVFSGFEGAQTAAALQTTWPPAPGVLLFRMRAHAGGRYVPLAE